VREEKELTTGGTLGRRDLTMENSISTADKRPKEQGNSRIWPGATWKVKERHGGPTQQIIERKQWQVTAGGRSQGRGGYHTLISPKLGT